MADLPKLRAVVFQSGAWWLAQFLEYDLVAVSVSLNKLPQEVERILTLQVLVSSEQGIAPFEGYTPAPRRFWQRYEEAAPLASPCNTELRLSESPHGLQPHRQHG